MKLPTPVMIPIRGPRERQERFNEALWTHIQSHNLIVHVVKTEKPGWRGRRRLKHVLRHNLQHFLKVTK